MSYLQSSQMFCLLLFRVIVISVFAPIVSHLHTFRLSLLRRIYIFHFRCRIQEIILLLSFAFIVIKSIVRSLQFLTYHSVSRIRIISDVSALSASFIKLKLTFSARIYTAVSVKMEFCFHHLSKTTDIRCL